MIPRAATALAWLATLLYPLAVWFGLARLEPRGIAALLAVIAVLRAIAAREAVWWVAAAGAGLLAVVASLANHGLPLKLYPVLVNLAMLVVFATSLYRPPTVIERLARLRHPDLPESARPYLANVTRAWCLFFVANGAIALWTALAASDATWALYNGFIAYLLMGAMFLGERLARPRHAS